MKVVSVYNMKGGVGKTTICANLAYSASCEGYSTLLIDLDPQGAASYYFRIKASKKFDSKKLISSRKKVYNSIKGSDYDYLDIIPASMSYRDLDVQLDSEKKSKKLLKKILSMFKDEYDIIFLDAPPNLTLLSENIFAASNLMIVPLIPTHLSLTAYEKLNEFLKKRYKSLSCGIVFSMLDSRKALHNTIVNEFVEEKNRKLMRSIPNSYHIEKMGKYREPVLVKHPKTKAALSFRELWIDVKNSLKI